MAPDNEHPGPPQAARRTEPIAKALAGRRWFPLWALIHHRGRRSGTEYATPIAVVPTTDKSLIMIGLPWGTTTNWARNVITEDAATLTWKGRDHETIAPRIIDPVEAAALARPAFRFVVRRMPAAIVLTRAGRAAPRNQG